MKVFRANNVNNEINSDEPPFRLLPVMVDNSDGSISTELVPFMTTDRFSIAGGFAEKPEESRIVVLMQYGDSGLHTTMTPSAARHAGEALIKLADAIENGNIDEHLAETEEVGEV